MECTAVSSSRFERKKKEDRWPPAHCTRDARGRMTSGPRESVSRARESVLYGDHFQARGRLTNAKYVNMYELNNYLCGVRYYYSTTVCMWYDLIGITIINVHTGEVC